MREHCFFAAPALIDGRGLHGDGQLLLTGERILFFGRSRSPSRASASAVCTSVLRGRIFDTRKRLDEQVAGARTRKRARHIDQQPLPL